ncbi:4Fe-4S double cluster binding domain-containing protein [candidate division KSB1 bacterium]
MKENEKITVRLRENLAAGGFKSSIVSVKRLHKLKDDIENQRQLKSFSGKFFDGSLSHLKFEPPGELKTAASVIVTAAQQTKINVKFKLSGKTHPVIIPPIYSLDTDEKAFNIISQVLNDYGYKTAKAVLPEKLLAVRSGLAEYGKNNITYINGWGSFFRIRAFYSDLPCNNDDLQEFKMMDRCEKCSACIKKCPTNAILTDRFLVKAEQCLTYFNEGQEKFPEWLDPLAHNCLIGCMVCQEVCPLNRDNINKTTGGFEFSETETKLILNGTAKDRLPESTFEKLRKLWMLEDYDLLKRNLAVLINKAD